MGCKRLVLIVLAFLCCTVGAARAEPLLIYTENYPPYNFLDESGQVVGLATENVRQVLDASGLDYEIRLVPWVRAMHFVETNPNALIFSLTRTPSREGKFDWLVPLADSIFYVFNRQSDVRMVTSDAIKRGMFTGACVTNDLGCELFRTLGMPAEKLIRIGSNETADFRMVAAERADLYISDINVNTRMRLSEGFDPSLTKPVLRIEGKTGFYLAGATHLSQPKRTAIRNAYDSLMKINEYQLVKPKR